MAKTFLFWLLVTFFLMTAPSVDAQRLVGTIHRRRAAYGRRGALMRDLRAPLSAR